jgi:hypothetical protein
VLNKYGFASKIRKFFAGTKHADRFMETGQRLSVTHNILCHALSIHLAMDASDRELEHHEMMMQAIETDSRLYHADVQSAIQMPSLLGVSPDELPQAVHILQLVAQDNALSETGTAPAAYSPGGSSSSVTLADLQRCSWRIRSELLTFDQKEGKRGKILDVLLGSGTFGDVYAATYCGERVVVKKMRNPAKCDAAHSASVSQALASFVSEVSLACALNHPNIVHTVGGVVDEEEEPPCWIVMERLDQSLPKVRPTHLQRSLAVAHLCRLRSQALASLSDQQKLRIMIGLCSALLYMHSKRPDSKTPEPYENTRPSRLEKM